jgi:hypothetical protein
MTVLIGGGIMAIENNVANFNGFFIADVLGVDKTKRRLAVHIPKLMPAIANGADPRSSETITSSNTIVDGINFSQTIKVRNTIWALPWDYNEPLPEAGSKVTVRFFDGNPRNAYWDKFNPIATYTVIEEERYPTLYNLSINGSSIQVNSEDTVSIIFPEDYSIVQNTDGKNKTFSITKDSNNYIISDQEPENLFNGLMWYKTSTSELFIYVINSFKKVTLEEVE